MSRMTAFAVALAAALIGLPQPGAAAEAVVLQLHAPAQFEFAGYYAALWRGYYSDAGLAVEIRPGGKRAQTAIDPVREVSEGRAQLGTGTMQLVVRRVQGLPILLVAPIFQQSGAQIYYRGDSDFSSPAALVKARLGRLAASDILDIELATALRAEGIDPTRIKSVTVEPSQAVAALADKTIDAVVGSAWIVPWQAHERGIILKSFNPANYRVEYYGDSLFTLQRFEAAEPQTVARFRAASLKGWEYALQHPEEIAARLVAEKLGDPVADPAGFTRYQTDVARRLSRYTEIPLGYSNPDRWTQIEAGMLGAGAVERTVDLTSFVYNPAAEPPISGSPYSLGLVIAVAGAGLAAVAVGVGGFFGWRWYQRRPRAPPVEKAPEPISLPASLTPGARRQPVALAPPPAAAPPAPAPLKPVSPPPPPQQPPPLQPPPPVDLNAVLGPLDRAVKQRVRGKVRYRFSLLPELWPVRIEGAAAVAPIVLNLVSAATAAMDEDGSLIVGTRNVAFNAANLADYPGAEIGEFARITVRDNGPGLPEAALERILDPAASARPALATAAAAVARLGGFVRVESAEDVGTAVHLYFRRVPEGSDAALAPIKPEPTAEVAE